MSNEALAPARTGELRADGTYVVARTEKANGWVETKRIGKLKIRGEKEARTISYGDYAKLAGFYNAQERLIKDRKNIMVTLSGGAIVNTADITSLDFEDEEQFVAKTANVSERIRKLPTRRLMLTMTGKIITETPTRIQEQSYREDFIIADCHYEEQDGKPKYYTALDLIPNAEQYRPNEDGYQPCIRQFWHYGIPQLG